MSNSKYVCIGGVPADGGGTWCSKLGGFTVLHCFRGFIVAKIPNNHHASAQSCHDRGQLRRELDVNHFACVFEEDRLYGGGVNHANHAFFYGVGNILARGSNLCTCFQVCWQRDVDPRDRCLGKLMVRHFCYLHGAHNHGSGCTCGARSHRGSHRGGRGVHVLLLQLFLSLCLRLGLGLGLSLSLGLGLYRCLRLWLPMTWKLAQQLLKVHLRGRKLRRSLRPIAFPGSVVCSVPIHSKRLRARELRRAAREPRE
mmetsp:Transcript_8948/g.16509  ORF Transcript_8948/g.16509 Transcript_8948/m.16509 type:complete len:255 (-) Transcript_8948:174-938(-)